MEIFTDKALTCISCSLDFIFTKGEQDFFFKKNLDIPKRCPECRKKKVVRNKKRQKKFLAAIAVREYINIEII